MAIPDWIEPMAATLTQERAALAVKLQTAEMAVKRENLAGVATQAAPAESPSEGTSPPAAP